jgi:hypothetical protein
MMQRHRLLVLIGLQAFAAIVAWFYILDTLLRPAATTSGPNIGGPLALTLLSVHLILDAILLWMALGRLRKH